jgi:hypothetical protein
MKKIIYFILISLPFLVQSSSINLSENDNEDLVKATNYIMENIFFKKFSTVNIISSVQDPKDDLFLNFEDKLLKMNKGFSIYRLDNHSHIQYIQNRLKIFNVFLLDNFSTFKALNKSITSDKFSFRGFYLFVLINGVIEEIEEIFQTMWTKYIINVNVLFKEHDKVNLTTFIPFSKGNCYNTSSRNWATFQNGSFNKIDAEIFPDKLKNLHNCSVRFATFHRCPSVCPGRKVNTIYGFDVEIISLIKTKMNMRRTQTFLHGAEQWGTILPNGTATGALNRIVTNQSDVIYGGYLLRASRLQIMDSSNVYLSFPIVFVVPEGEKLTAFETLLRPFELVVWIFLVVTLAAAVIVILIVNMTSKEIRAFVYGTGIKTPIVNMLIAMFGGSQKKLPKRNFSRFLLMMFLLFCLVKRNVYQGSLYIFIQSDGRHKEVQSTDEMIEKGFKFHMYDSYSDIIKINPKIYNK